MNERYGSLELQPDDGWGIVRSNTVLADAGVADDAGDDDDDNDGTAAADVDVGRVSLPGDTSPSLFLRSIVWPIKPPATPAINISNTP